MTSLSSYSSPSVSDMSGHDTSSGSSTSKAPPCTRVSPPTDEEVLLQPLSDSLPEFCDISDFELPSIEQDWPGYSDLCPPSPPAPAPTMMAEQVSRPDLRGILGRLDRLERKMAEVTDALHDQRSSTRLRSRRQRLKMQMAKRDFSKASQDLEGVAQRVQELQDWGRSMNGALRKHFEARLQVGKEDERESIGDLLTMTDSGIPRTNVWDDEIDLSD